jgi:hypothetical protein
MSAQLAPTKLRAPAPIRMAPNTAMIVSSLPADDELPTLSRILSLFSAGTSPWLIHVSRSRLSWLM